MSRSTFSTLVGLLPVLGLGLGTTGCISLGERAGLRRELEARDVLISKLRRDAAEQHRALEAMALQVTALQGFPPDRPATIFAPTSLEMASLSGGRNTDDHPGDDAVVVHLRLVDADGDRVKSPGRISVQLLDHSTVGQPVVLGTLVVQDADALRTSWYGRYGTYHYALVCPFSPGAVVPPTGNVDVHVEFVDYLTGRLLTTVRTVHVAR